MSWLRQAGGFWVNPADPQTPIPVDSHAPYAWEALVAMVMPPEEEAALRNQYISELEQKKTTVVEPEGGEPKVDYKADAGGAEAATGADNRIAEEKKRRVQQQYNVTSGMGAVNVLRELGWVHINTDEPTMVLVLAKDEASLLVAEGAVMAEAANRDLIVIHLPNEKISLLSASITTDLATAIAAQRAKRQEQPVAETNLDMSGLGSWRVAGADKKISFSADTTVDFIPSNPQGKQWCVVSAQGKQLASGPSRKWAERNKRASDWQRSRKA